MSNISLKQVPSSSVPTPAANYAKIFSNISDGGKLYVKNSSGDSELIGGSSYVPVTEVTYSELYSLYNSSSFVPGSYYLITNFESMYKQPDFYLDGSIKPNLVTKGKPSGWGYQPILVMAVSSNALAIDAYQPNISGGGYPGFYKDKIKYDFLSNQTEFGDFTKGRIIERLDEFGNRTDYDHRTILFKRYQNYERVTQLTGSITDYDCTTGDVTGGGTSFLSELIVGDIIILDSKGDFGYDIGLKVKTITSNTSMMVEVDSAYVGVVPSAVSLANSTSITPITYSFFANSISFWSTTPTGEFNQYKEVYFGQSDSDDFDEYYTFDTDSFNNILDNYSYLYESGDTNRLILSNNVFGKSLHNNVKSICSNNTIGDNFENNNISNTFEYNIIGNSFMSNDIFGEFNSNKIKSYFQYNKLNGMFTENIFNGSFFKNNIVYNFESNNVGENVENNSFFSTINNSNLYDDFRCNIIERGADISAVDFTTSSFVKSDYTCTIFRNSNGDNRLSYYNASDALSVNDITD